MSIDDKAKPAPGSVWEHHSGRRYRVLFVANDERLPKPSYPPTVVYEGLENRKCWAGRLDDWHRRMTPSSSDTGVDEAVDRIALALRYTAHQFENPVSLYVEPEAQRRDYEAIGWDAVQDKAEGGFDYDFESWRILARGVLSAQPVAGGADADADADAVEARARAAWDSISDGHNQWHCLSLDERDTYTEFAAALASLSPVPTSGAEGEGEAVRPLDFSNVLRHAFLSGVVAAREIPQADECDGPALWAKYEPYEPGAYQRVCSALSPAPTSGSDLPSCIACEDNPKAPNDPCAVCGKTSGSEAGGDDTTKIALGHFQTTTERAQEITKLEAVIAGLNKQLTEQFDLTTKQASRIDELQRHSSGKDMTAKAYYDNWQGAEAKLAALATPAPSPAGGVREASPYGNTVQGDAMLMEMLNAAVDENIRLRAEIAALSQSGDKS